MDGWRRSTGVFKNGAATGEKDRGEDAEEEVEGKENGGETEEVEEESEEEGDGDGGIEEEHDRLDIPVDTPLKGGVDEDAEGLTDGREEEKPGDRQR